VGTPEGGEGGLPPQGRTDNTDAKQYHPEMQIVDAKPMDVIDITGIDTAGHVSPMPTMRTESMGRTTHQA
jgi:hypothetical protein